MFKEEVKEYFSKQSSFITDPGKLAKEKDAILDILRKSFAHACGIENVVAYKKAFLKMNSYVITTNYYYSNKNHFALYGITDIEKIHNKWHMILVDGTKQDIHVEEDAVNHIRKVIAMREKYLEMGHKYAYGNGVEKNLDLAKKYYAATVCEDYNTSFYANYINGTANDYLRMNHLLLAEVYYLEAARMNNCYAHYNLGNNYYYGRLGIVDYQKAKEHFVKSVEINPSYADARYMLGWSCKMLEDYDSMYRYVKDGKDARFYNLIGEYYRLSNKKDYELSKKYHLMAVKEDLKYTPGLVVLLNQMGANDECYLYLKKAVDAGEANCYNNLGYMYEHGYGVEQDYVKAKECYEKYNQHFPDSYYGFNNLGIMYLEGRGVSCNYKMAYELFSKALENGSNVAKYNLAKMYIKGYYVQQDIDKGLSYLEEAMNEKIISAYLYKVQLLVDGKYVDKNMDEAMAVLNKAIEIDNAERAVKEYVKYVVNGEFGSDIEDIRGAYEVIKNVYQTNPYIEKEYKQIRDYYYEVFSDSVRPSVAYEDLCQESTEVVACYFTEENGRKVFLNPYTLIDYVSFEDGLFPPLLEAGDLLSLVLLDGQAIYGDYIKESDLLTKNPASSHVQTCKWHMSSISKDPMNLCNQASEIFSVNIDKAFELYRCAAIQDYFVGFLGMGDVYYSKNKYDLALKMYRRVLKSSDLTQSPRLMLMAISRYLAVAQMKLSKLPDHRVKENFELAMAYLDVAMHKVPNNKVYKAYMAYKEGLTVKLLDSLRFSLKPEDLLYELSKQDLAPISLALECYSATLWLNEHKLGNKEAAYRLVDFYSNKNRSEMAEWKMVTYERGDSEALYDAAYNPEEYGLDGDDDERFALLKEAARRGNYNAQAELSLRADAMHQQLRHLEGVLDNSRLTDREIKNELELINKNLKYNVNKGPAPSALKDIFKD